MERLERVTKFTEFSLQATLTVGAGTDMAKARQILEKAESNCLITNLLEARCHLQTEVLIES